MNTLLSVNGAVHLPEQVESALEELRLEHGPVLELLESDALARWKELPERLLGVVREDGVLRLHQEVELLALVRRSCHTYTHTRRCTA